MLTSNEVDITHGTHTIEVSAIIGGHRVSRVYIGYTEKESVLIFLYEVNRLGFGS
jgi:hypothetical protein